LHQTRPVRLHPARAWCEVHAPLRRRVLHLARASPQNYAQIFTNRLLNS
jgi:hypothetical protein